MSFILTAQAATPSLPPALSALSQQQQPTGSTLHTFTGTIVDENGDPAMGVAILVGQTSGYMTNAKGVFEFRTKNTTERVRISLMGYKTQILTLQAGKPIRVKLEPESSTLSDVVVTGFTKKDKKSYTGSQTTIQARDLLAVGTKNILQSLEAFVPGLKAVSSNDLGSNPNERPNLNIRGRASFDGAANLPLFVVDGAIVDVDYIYDMDVNTIESVTVLKDASASALYGAKAAAGVIVLTTKPIKEGRIRLNYSGTLRLSVPDLTDYHLLNPEQKFQYEELAGRFSAVSPDGTHISMSNQKVKDDLRNRVLGMVRQGTNIDWLAKPLRTGVSHSHSLAAEGGDRFVRYGLTLRYGNDDGVMKQSSRERVSGSFRLSYNQPQKFFVSNTLTLNRISSENPSYGSFSTFVKQNPYQSPYGEDGHLRTSLGKTSNPNPLYEMTLGSFNNQNSIDFLNNTSLQVWLGKFRIDGDLSISSRTDASRRFRSPLSYVFRRVADLTQRGDMYESFTRGLNITGRLMVSYNRTFFQKLFVTSMLGSSLESNKSDASSYTSLGYYSDVLGHPHFGLGYGSGARPSGQENLSTAAGFFFNGNAIYDNRYSVDVVYRYEGSSKFGKNTRFAPFWSLGGAWNVHNESFFKGNKNIQLLKLRASIGYLGNMSFEPYQALTTYDYNSGLNYILGPGSIPKSIGNPDLKWERVLSKNAGADITLFKNRLDLTADVYQKITDNLLLDVTKAPSIGISQAKENLGQVENRGIELQARVVAIQTKDWQWSISANYTYNQNKILKISDALRESNRRTNEAENAKRPTQTPAGGTVPSTTDTSRPNLTDAQRRNGLELPPIYEEGESLSALKVVRSAGIDPATGREIFIKRDGSFTYTYDANDKVIVGDSNPLGSGSISSYLYYKGFSLTASFGYSFGAKAYNSTLVTRIEGANKEFNADERVFTDRWKRPGDITRFRDIATEETSYQTSRFVETNNYFTLRSLSLGYDIPQAWLKQFRFRQARLELLTNDLFYWSTVKRERGLDYPFARSVEMSLRIGF